LSNETVAVSQALVESSAPVASNEALHETVVSSVIVVLFVANGALLSVNGPAITVPVQSRLSYSVNVTVPGVPAGVTVAVSCGIHLCAVLTVVGCLTVKHSVADESELGGTPFVASPLNSPLKQYVPAASGLAAVFTSADKIGCVVVLLTGMSEPTCVPPVEQTLFVSWAGVHRKNFMVPDHVDVPSTVMVAESLTAVPDVTPPAGMAEPSLASTGWVSVPEPHVPNEPRVKSFSVAVTDVDDRVSAKAVEKH
jgi:hypothetical protein